MPTGSPVADQFLSSTMTVFRYHKELAERAVAQIPDEKLHVPVDPNTNSIAVIMKHVAGNLRSRWTDFLTTDGEKPWRDRDDEFVDTHSGRDEVLAQWDSGWNCLFETLASLSAEDLARTVTIRGEPHSVPLALQRSLAHTAYHVGQIVQVARLMAGDDWRVLTIARKGSASHNATVWGKDQYAAGPSS